MSDEERTAIQVQLDNILTRLNEIRDDRRECRAHCDAEVPRVHKRIDALKETVDRMHGNPPKLYALGIWAAVVISAIGLIVGLRGVIH